MVSDNPESFADLDGHYIGQPPPGGFFPGSPYYGGPQGCSLDGISMACAAISIFNGGPAANDPFNAEDAAAEEALQNQAQRQVSFQDSIISDIFNFDANVDAATEADIARGSSSNASIDADLHNESLRENGQLEVQVHLKEEDLHKADLKKEIEAYVSGASEPELKTFLGRLSRVQYMYDKENAKSAIAGKIVTWAASKSPGTNAGWTIIKWLAGTPAKQQLITYGIAAVNKQLDALGSGP